jgi:hypothetical protein
MDPASSIIRQRRQRDRLEARRHTAQQCAFLSSLAAFISLVVVMIAVGLLMQASGGIFSLALVGRTVMQAIPAGAAWHEPVCLLKVAAAGLALALLLIFLSYGIRPRPPKTNEGF